MLRNPAKQGLVMDTLRTMYRSDEKAVQRVIDLASTVNKYALLKREQKLDNQNELEEPLQFTLPAHYKAKLRIIANETRDVRGRRLGMQSFVRRVIMDLIDRKFGGQHDTTWKT